MSALPKFFRAFAEISDIALGLRTVLVEARAACTRLRLSHESNDILSPFLFCVLPSLSQPPSSRNHAFLIYIKSSMAAQSIQPTGAGAAEKMVNSCMAVTCDKCGKTTWRGCGRHIDAVFANVPPEQRCTCPRS